MAAEVEPAPEEVPFPIVEQSQMPGRFSIRLTFGDPQDLALFHRWITKGGGWAAFGTYVDERRG